MDFEWDSAKAVENLRKHRVFCEKRNGETTDALRPEYDMAELLKSGARGKYAERFKAGMNLVLLEPEVHSQFKTEKDVNDALRLVIELRKICGRRRLAR